MIGEKSTLTLILTLLAIQTVLLSLVLVRVGALTHTVSASKSLAGSLPSSEPGELVEGFQAGNGPSLGAPDAPITLVEFSDFTCPSCASLKSQVNDLLERYPEDVRLVFRYFPLAPSGPPFQTALAAECARHQDAFWPMHDSLFTKARTLRTDQDLYQEADDLGLDMASFTQCMASEAASSVVNRDSEAGLSYGISGTPTLFVNGRRFVGSGAMPRIEQEIQRLLDSA